MVAAARRRNRREIAAGRVRLTAGSVERLPFADASFDAVCGVNTFQFWPDPGRNLWEVRRVLRPGGRLVITLRAGPGEGSE